MADNVVADAGSGGATFAADDIGGVHHQRVKVQWGADGSATDTAVATPFPTVQTGALPAGTNNIGDVDVLTLPALVAGTAGIGKLTANSGVDIGDVDVLSIAAGDNNIGNVDVVTLPALVAGSAAIGKLAANSGVDIGDVDVTSISAGTNSIGNVGIVPRTTGGTTIFRSIDLDETEEEIKATAGQLFGYYIFNAAATTHYVKFYNATAANVTVGSTTPVLTIPVPAGSAANLLDGIGIAFGTAITAAATTGIADADTGAPAANAVTLNAFFT